MLKNLPLFLAERLVEYPGSKELLVLGILNLLLSAGVAYLDKNIKLLAVILIFAKWKL